PHSHRPQHRADHGDHGAIRHRAGHGVEPDERHGGARDGAGGARHGGRAEIRDPRPADLIVVMAKVALEKLNNRYGVVPAVIDVDLAIAENEFVVLVGPSGCGKSTTLRMVAGLEDATSGTIRIGERVVNGLAPKDRDIAMVFQNYALYQHMTIYDNLAFGLRNRKVPEDVIRSEVARAAEILGIGDLLKRKPRQLSGGQQQRVALGRCIVRHPQVFLFDEPLSNLDAELRAHMRIELKRLRERIAVTSTYLTHNHVDAMTLGDRVVVMRDG